jgi:hypothetical protein
VLDPSKSAPTAHVLKQDRRFGQRSHDNQRHNVAATATRWPLWAALGLAALAWAVVSLGLYALARATGHGDDEPQ